MPPPAHPGVTPAMVARGRTIADPRLSPDATRVAFVVRTSAGTHLAVVAVDGGAEQALVVDPAPGMPHPTGGGTVGWAGADTLVYAATDGTIRAVAATGGRTRIVVPWGPAGNVTVSPDGTGVAFVLDSTHVGIAPVDGTAWPTRRSGGEHDFAIDPAWSPDGAHVAWQEWDDPHLPWDNSRIVEDGRTVAGGAGVAVAQPRYASDGTLGYLADDGGWLNLHDHGEPHEHGLPVWGPGVRTWAWSPEGTVRAFARNEDGFGRLCLTGTAGGAGRELGKGWHYGLDWRRDHLVAIRTGARTPPQLVAYETASGARRVLATSGAGGWTDDNLIEPEPVTWRGDDGASVHGRLYAPGPERPLLVWVHGGPTDQHRVEFHPLLAWFVDGGWAILVVDHRGSTGHGRAYQQAMNGRWGELDVADTAAGTHAAHTRGWGDRDGNATVAIGASAGGFTVLHLLARHPDLFAAGVARYPVGDLPDLNERTHRFERHYNDVLVGALDAQRQRSPVTFADRIATPLLLVHGDADPVVPVDQSRAIAERVPDVELHVYEGEGHGWRRPETVEDELARIDDFLWRRVLRWAR